MSRGGARTRSGPQPDPNSARTEIRGITFTQLPSEGYAGDFPAFPLPAPTVRELAIWEQTWRTPQAAAWIMAPHRWRDVAMYVRYSVRMEAEDAPVGLAPVVMRLADEIGLTVAGLRANGWQLATDQVAAKRVNDEPRTSARDRLRVANGTD